MVRITRVYTKTGDKGDTALVGGRRVSKDHPRIAAYGTIDELLSIMGMVRSINLQKESSLRRDKFEIILQAIQQKLFDLGSQLATAPGDEYAGQIKIIAEDTVWLEQVLDAMNEECAPLKSFVLPGGGPLTSTLHLARTVCRRAERQMLFLHRTEPLDEQLIPYINRLSDALFVFSRWVSVSLGESEFLWQPGKDRPQNWQWK